MFNEPGYERRRNTAHGKKQAKAYNVAIRRATLQFAMLEMLKNPPAGFEEVGFEL